MAKAAATGGYLHPLLSLFFLLSCLESSLPADALKLCCRRILCDASFLLARLGAEQLVSKPGNLDIICTTRDPSKARWIQNYRMKLIRFGFLNDLQGRFYKNNSPCLLQLMFWTTLMNQAQGKQRWEIMSTFPLPMLNWSSEFEQTLRDLRMAVIQINSTHLDLSLTEGLSTWISSTVPYFKEWAGVGMFGLILCGGLVVVFWLVCRLKTQGRRDKIAIAQALIALDQGASVDVWLTMLNQ